MARIKMLEKDEVGPIAAELFQKQEDSSGRVINLFKVLAHSEKIVRDWSRLGTTLLNKGDLRDDLRELAIIRVGELADAPYELAAHRAIGLRSGLSQSQIDDVADWQQSGNFNEVERAVLQYTDEVANDYRTTDQSFARLETHFSSKEIVELTVTIGYYGMVARTLESLQVNMEV
jgi:alkylhydroperoxidase family enzyme